MPKKPKTISPEETSNASLSPLMEWVHAKPGRLAELIERLRVKTGKRYHRNNVSLWMKGQQPKYGVGLILVDIWGDITREETGNAGK